MAFLNIVILPTKTDEIHRWMSNKNIDLTAFNKTRLHFSIYNLIHIDDYEVIRKDRSHNRGGVCIYLCSSINYKVRSDLIPTELEAVCLEIAEPQSKPFVTTIYHPPSATSEFFWLFWKTNWTKWQRKQRNVYLRWSKLQLVRRENAFQFANKLNSLCELYQLTQLITEPTWITVTTSILSDHVVTNTPEKILLSGVVHYGGQQLSLEICN